MRRLYERRYIFVVLLREKIFTIRIFSFFFIFSLHWIFKIEILDFSRKKFFSLFFHQAKVAFFRKITLFLRLEK